MICLSCLNPIPEPLIACPACYALPQPEREDAAQVREAKSPPILCRLPVMEVSVYARKNGFLSAQIGDGRNILARRRITRIKRARKVIMEHLTGKFGQAVEVKWLDS